MKKFTLLLLLSFSFLLAFTQDMKYSRVRIYTDFEGIQALASRGIPVDEAEIRPGVYITCEISEADIAKVAALGYPYDILIDDMSKYYEERNAKEMGNLEQLRNADYILNRDWPVPDGFSLGSVGGFCSIDEMLDNLDSMVTHYPNLISPVYQLDSLTHEGRPVYWVRISDNPTQDEDEPEVLYTGMHHAREPIGMQHLLYFMNYLLEHYDSDPEIQYIIDNTELYFVPIVNIDGYAYNIYTDPEGGGMWRKTRRDNGDGTYGVDPNRNYGYAWGWDDNGSSPYTYDETYRGPYAFSEPCIQDIRDFCLNHNFVFALNYHSYQGLLLYPWGYLPDLPPDNEVFSDFSSIMTLENGYAFGPGYATIYPTNGGSDDWMYGEQTDKNKILSFTPEVGDGNDGFWPSVNNIIPLCQENMWQSMMIALLAGPYSRVDDQSPSIVENMEGYFHFSIERLGLDSNGTYTVSIIPLNDAIESEGDPKIYSDLGLLETLSDSISYTLRGDIQSGDEIVYLLSVDNGSFVSSDTLQKIYGTPVVVFEDDGNSFTKWSSNKWNTTTADFHSPDKSITDSPYGNYNNYETNTMVLSDPIDLADAAYAILGFWAKWEIEAGYDYVQVEASTNGQTWIPLSGKYTKTGNDYQAPGEPVYDGYQSDWVNEEMDLSAFTGQQVYLRFTLKSDTYVTYDGFYWDDMTVTIIDIATGIDKPGVVGTINVNPVPNPAHDLVRFSFRPDPKIGRLKFFVYNSTGELMTVSVVENANDFNLTVTGWPGGIYFYQFKADGQILNSGKLVIW